MSTKRIEFIDLAKGFCIFFVVFRHTILCFPVDFYFEKQFTSFRMPLYFILSGLFFKEYSGFCDFLCRKINKLLIPYFFFFIILSLIVPFLMESLGFELNHHSHITYSSLFSFFTERAYVNNPIWFLLCLFDVNIIFYIIIIISKRMRQSISIIVVVTMSLFIGCIGYMLGTHFHTDLPLYVDTAMTAVPFFAFGYVMRRYTEILTPNDYDKYLYCIIPLMFMFLMIFACDVRFLRNIYEDNSFLSLYSCGIIGTLMILFIAKKIRFLPMLSYIGRYSIMILCTHMYLITVYVKLMTVLHFTGWIAALLVVVLTLLSYFLLIPLMKKYMPYVTAQKDVIKLNK